MCIVVVIKSANDGPDLTPMRNGLLATVVDLRQGYVVTAHFRDETVPGAQVVQ